MRRAVNHANHITAVDAIAIGVAAGTRTASIDIITIARTSTGMDHARTKKDIGIRDTAIATRKMTTEATESTAKDIVADLPDATRSEKRK